MATSAPTHRHGYDENYNMTSRPTTPQERRDWLGVAVREWETKATDLEERLLEMQERLGTPSPEER